MRPWAGMVVLLSAWAAVNAQVTPVPMARTADNQPITVRVLVLNYDPIIASEGGKRLHEVFQWNDPRHLAAQYEAAMERASDGAVRFELVAWRDLDEIYAQKDGYRYNPEEYVKLRRADGGWHDGGGVDYPRLLAEQGVPALVDAPSGDPRRVDEVWIFGDHYFGLWEASMAGPGAFFINGGVYPKVPVKRPFAFYGFNYERGLDCMLHNTAHRAEATLNRVFGGWQLAEPQNDWELFSANHTQSNGVAGVGTCHWPANAEHDYDYANERVVQSWAEDFRSYPNLSCRDRHGGLGPVSRASWSQPIDGRRDDQSAYLIWYFSLLPRAPGVGPDGRQHNWYKYLYDFANYGPDGKPAGPRLSPSDRATRLHDAALTAKRAGDPARAERLLIEALAADPDHISAHWVLGWILANSGRREAAREHFQFVVEQQPRTSQGDEARAALERLER